LARTGERLQEEDPLYAVDLARHRVAYHFAREQLRHLAREQRRTCPVLDLGCGTGYGSALLSQAEQAARVVGLDRARPGRESRHSRAIFVRGDLNCLPFAAEGFDLVVSFQVIEHLEDPSAYLAGISRVLRPEGVALLTTPNRLQSDRENPYHVHEYEADELAGLLGRYFERVEMRGVGARGAAWSYHEQRLRQIRRIVRLDPLQLRRRLPRPLVEWAFARLSVVVRHLIGARQ